MTTEYTAAEQAAAEALRREFYDGVGMTEFADAGRAAAEAAEPFHQIGAYEEAADALGQLVDLHLGSGMSEAEARGVHMARNLITDQAAAIRDDLAEAGEPK
ncbi:hypothetical protein AB0B28_08295 [Glycomyces sp. NPDC046736]|uniref:hypothetical protein n=1 Tax=Glycomyces sp. NPDC046736 TaxID=3155615 RepID=UPI0034104F91